MKICFLLTTSLESPYGEGRCLPLARELAALGHDVQILALHHDLPNCEKRNLTIPTSGSPIDIRYVGQMHVRKRHGQKLYFPAWQLAWVVLTGFFGLLVAGLNFPADVIHVGKPQPANGMAGWLISRLPRRSLFVDCDDYEAEANRFSGRWQKILVSLVEDWLPRQAVGITVNTHFLAKRYQALGVPINRIVRVPNGTSSPAMESKSWPSALKGLLEELASVPTPVIVYVGTLALESHPVNLLLDAFSQVVKVLPDARLLLVGGGPDEVYLRQLASTTLIGRQIIFTGQVSATEALHAYRVADVTVDPVYANDVARARCPLKLMESLDAGCPIVTGDVGDRREWLGEEFADWLVEPGSASALADGLLRVLESKNKWSAKSIRQRATLFNWGSLAIEWQKVYALHKK